VLSNALEQLKIVMRKLLAITSMAISVGLACLLIAGGK
jgi:hypothetical protein